jgi:membrane associated rhomboid family serine protease
MAALKRSKSRTWSQAVEISALLVALLFAVALLDWLLPVQLIQLGILPRTARGFVGIIFSPVLHYSWAHLTANAFPLFILLVLLFWDSRYWPEAALLWVWLASGLGTWLIGRGDAIHIGASSIIYGLVVYLIAAGWWIRNWRAILVGVFVLLFYGGIFFGIMPQRGLVSWEGHLAGVLAGWWVAKKHHG